MVGGAALAIMLGCWLSSGTMAPYGTYGYGRCQYRANGDHFQFQAVFLMLDGQPAARWEDSVVLRRILHPLLAYPLMKVFGFTSGGLIFNIVMHGLTLVALALAFRRYFDARAAVLVSWLLASYPGYAYWAGLPFSYAVIVPGSIACTIALLWWNDRPSLARSVIAACVVGVVGLGYDLMPYFGGALLLLTVAKRRWLDLGVAIVVLGLWGLFIAWGLPEIFGFAAINSNSQTYGAVIRSYLDVRHRLSGWGSVLVDVPHVFVSNFLFSGMVFFPLLFVAVIAVRWRGRSRPVFGPVALSILLSTLAVFLFLNLAPPYVTGWQLRGTWIARLYQPWFVTVLVVVAATSVAVRGRRSYKVLLWAVVVTAVLDGVAIAGPYIGIQYLYLQVNENFYQVKELQRNDTLLKQLGVRPYGICK
jgi:hypothetical protein